MTFKAMSVTDQDVYPYVDDIFYWRLQDIFLELEEIERSHERIMFSKEAPKGDGLRFSKEAPEEDILFRLSYDDMPKFSRETEKADKPIKDHIITLISI